jgi:hypothetical protein
VHGAGVQLSGAQMLPLVPFATHCPLQQSLLTPQAALSATHALFPQAPFTQEPRQHSLPVAHVAPVGLQLIGLPQIVPPSVPIPVQFALQHCVLFAQSLPFVLHGGASLSEPPSPPSVRGPPSPLPELSPPLGPSVAGEVSPVVLSPPVLVSTVPSSPPSVSGMSVGVSLPHAHVSCAINAQPENRAKIA